MLLETSANKKHLDSVSPEYVVPCSFRYRETEIKRRVDSLSFFLRDMDSLSLQVNYGRPVFVKPDRQFDCPVCMQTVWQAVQTTCGHRLCDICFTGLVRETGRALCPVADEECEMLTSNRKNVFRDAYAIREVLKMDVFCKNHIHGCQEVMQCKNLLSHLEGCEYTALSCLNPGCPETVARCHLDKHMKEQCGYHLLQCQYCGVVLPASSLQKHLDSDSPEYVVPCSFRYRETEIKRRQEKRNENDLLESQVQSLSSAATDLNAKCRELELALVSQQKRMIKVEALCRSVAAHTQEQYEAPLQSVESAAANPAARRTTGAAALPECRDSNFASVVQSLQFPGQKASYSRSIQVGVVTKDTGTSPVPSSTSKYKEDTSHEPDEEMEIDTSYEDMDVD